jgi:hypothetical protein
MRRGHLVCVRSRECELTRLAADRFIEAAAVLGPLLRAYNLQHHSRCEFTGDKSTEPGSASANAAEMDTNELAFARWTCGAVGNR